MSYPPPLYRGTKGELTVSYRPVSRPPDIVNTRTGNRVHYLATSQSTERKFGLYRWEMGPGESGPDPHFHRTITESFYVLEGSVRRAALVRQADIGRLDRRHRSFWMRGFD